MHSLKSMPTSPMSGGGGSNTNSSTDTMVIPLTAAARAYTEFVNGAPVAPPAEVKVEPRGKWVDKEHRAVRALEAGVS